ncbi:MAG TPA: FAD-dependent oxidoreductase [Gillisia sp.]|nr:FAD-dependent oxidoreductase [Gillisia sp.]
MSFSYWERQSWFSNVDFTIVGSGIVGLNAALDLKERFPSSNVLVLERGLLPNGASTKNAGFACFGSISEILEDLNYHSEEEVIELVKKRIKGLELLRKNLGDKTIGYEAHGGYELFTTEDEQLYEECLDGIGYVNKLLQSIFSEPVFSERENIFNFKNIKKKLVYSAFEGQINTGRMMTALLQKVQTAGVKILNNVTVKEFSENNKDVEVITNEFTFTTGKLLIANNGFASQLGIMEVKPARAQVLITKPIKDLHIKGTFHLEKGFYYFRNIDDRILLGGGRNLDLKAEETTEMELTALIQDKLDDLLKNTILPKTEFEIDHRWTGIMGVGNTKKPIVKQTAENIYCGVRLGGMGVAIGSLVGKELGGLVK